MVATSDLWSHLLVKAMVHPLLSSVYCISCVLSCSLVTA
jgi:hypothetical protein